MMSEAVVRSIMDSHYHRYRNIIGKKVLKYCSPATGLVVELATGFSLSDVEVFTVTVCELTFGTAIKTRYDLCKSFDTRAKAESYISELENNGIFADKI